VARDRQRAKQRKARREKSSRPDAAPDASAQPQEGEQENPLTRSDLSGELEHMTANVDQFDAALIAGAEGVTADEGVALGDGVEHPEALDDEDFAELEDRIDEVERAIETGDQDHIDEVEHDLDDDISERKRTRTASPAAAGATVAATKKGPGRFLAFLRASWAELRRVQWPDRRAVGQATAVVLGFVLVAGLYLGLVDALAKKLVDLII
jgi:preprotein translocase subunit SecE